MVTMDVSLVGLIISGSVAGLLLITLVTYLGYIIAIYAFILGVPLYVQSYTEIGMAKKFDLADTTQPSTSQKLNETDWELCVLCQKHTNERLSCPNMSKNKDHVECYASFAENLMKFDELCKLPRTILGRLDKGGGVNKTCIDNNAKWHKSCRLKYSNSKLENFSKRPMKVDDTGPASKYTRSSVDTNINIPESCFFCRSFGDGDLHSASTFELDKHVRESAKIIGDMELLGRLSEGDMIAIEAKYHTYCLVKLYNKARSVSLKQEQNDKERVISGIVYAELIMYIEDRKLNEDVAPVFKLCDLVTLYTSRMKSFDVNIDSRVNSTRLKEKLLSHFKDMRAHSQGRDIILVFEQDIGAAVMKAFEYDQDEEAVIIARAARIVRSHMHEHTKLPFSGSFSNQCQEKSVPNLLLALVNMIVDGPTIKDQLQLQNVTPAVLTISQLLMFNNVKHSRKHDKPHKAIRHSPSQETPLPIYMGLMVHAETRKRELVDKMSHLGISISYDRVLRLSSSIGDTVLQQYERENVVCPTSMRKSVFTTSAMDNIDHNPSSTTAKDSFHGTAISLIQHPTYADEGTERNIVLELGDTAVSKSIGHLPHYYTNVMPVSSNVKGSPIPPMNITTLDTGEFEINVQKEHEWLENAKQTIDAGQESPENVSWAAYHANKQEHDERPICTIALLPLFHHSAHTVAMIRHYMDVVKNAIHFLNPGQTPVLTFDQPLYALAKQIQWKWPESYGEDKYVTVFGGFHIEMAALKTLGDVLRGSGWAQAVVKAKIAGDGTADSFLHASHVPRTRRAHQVTATALYDLQQRAYTIYCKSHPDTESTFKQWCDEQMETSPQFQYWFTVLQIELCILSFIRSLRDGSFPQYMDALTKLVPWFCAMDHTNYARWIPIHLRDMRDLTVKHPQVASEFHKGNFVVRKSTRAFSAISIDHAHEQCNAEIKGDGGAVGLTDNPNALRRWMISGPEITRCVHEFEDQLSDTKHETLHHDQSEAVQKEYVKNVKELTRVIDNYGNPFDDQGTDLVTLHTREIMEETNRDRVLSLKDVGVQQFEAYTKERLVERKVPINDPIKRNNIKPFGCAPKKQTAKSKQLNAVKNEAVLFSRMYVACQTRAGDMDEFFKHENECFPPSLSDEGKLRTANKSALVSECLEKLISDPIEFVPGGSCLVIDGAAVIHMLNTGTCSTFGDYANVVFIPYINAQKFKRIDLIWDRYDANSLKATTRQKRGKGQKRRVEKNAPLPKKWKEFLNDDSNKQELFKFLSDALISTSDENTHHTEILVTNGADVLCVPPQNDMSLISPCNHEEADSRMMVHIHHASKQGHKEIVVRTVDTDVVVLAVMVSSILTDNCAIWLAFGTGPSFRYIPAHQIANSLGPQKSLALPMFHSVTGCDTVSYFAWHGKSTMWSTWDCSPN